jgi:hypothetical protein
MLNTTAMRRSPGQRMSRGARAVSKGHSSISVPQAISLAGKNRSPPAVTYEHDLATRKLIDKIQYTQVRLNLVQAVF